MPYRLEYLGTDPANESIPGVPASDHTVATAARRDELVASGLYRVAGPKAQTKAPKPKSGASSDDTGSQRG